MKIGYNFAYPMLTPLGEKTNSIEKIDKAMKNKNDGERNKTIKYLLDIYEDTKDFDFKYDIGKCIQILKGEENMEIRELKDVLEEVMEEKEKLFKENCELMCELEKLKEDDSMDSFSL